MLEIERKFLVKKLPEIESESSTRILQGYISQPGDSTEVRLRRKGNKFLITCKSGEGLTRHEYETEITEEAFTSLWPASTGRQIHKIRHRIPLQNGLVAELDLFEKDLDGLILCEVEFPDEETAHAFNPPKWFAEDVTEDQAYKNQSLAVSGIVIAED